MTSSQAVNVSSSAIDRFDGNSLDNTGKNHTKRQLAWSTLIFMCQNTRGSEYQGFSGVQPENQTGIHKQQEQQIAYHGNRYC